MNLLYVAHCTAKGTGESVDFLEAWCVERKKRRPQTAKKCRNTCDDSAEENKTGGRWRKKPKLSQISTESLRQGMNNSEPQKGDTYHVIEEMNYLMHQSPGFHLCSQPCTWLRVSIIVSEFCRVSIVFGKSLGVSGDKDSVRPGECSQFSLCLSHCGSSLGSRGGPGI